ncbi:MAG TPA: BMC domain-containing protein [Polyangia bacterium]|nr:BMC domain-containing protein [Polyangia bacterium]
MAEALALIELGSIARGHRVADAMLKRAPVGLLRADWVSPGKFLVLVEGGVAAVDEAFRAGLEVAADQVVDRLFLPQAHASLWPALAGEPSSAAVDSLGIVETTTVAATLLAADAAAKAAAVRLIELQLGRGIGGKGFFTVTGPLAEVEAAVEAAGAILEVAQLHATEIIAAPHVDLARKMRAKEGPPHTR